MERSLLDLNNKIYASNNNILFNIIQELQQTINESKENKTIQRNK
jgi:hypothetical protein